MFSHKWNEVRDECWVQQSMALDHTTMTWASPEEMQVRNGEKENCQNDGVCESQTSSYLTWSETVGTCDPHTQHSIWSGGAYSLPGIAGNLPTQPATDPLQHHCCPSQNSLFPVMTEPEVALPTMGPDQLNNCNLMCLLSLGTCKLHQPLKLRLLTMLWPLLLYLLSLMQCLLRLWTCN